MENPHYVITVDEVFYGPFTPQGLYDMEAQGSITATTQVMPCDGQNQWTTWNLLKPLLAPDQTARMAIPPPLAETKLARAFPPALPAAMAVTPEATAQLVAERRLRLQKMRDFTLYPTTRSMLFVPAIISSLASVIGWGASFSALSSNDSMSLGTPLVLSLTIASSLWTLVIFLLTSIARAILDMADRAAL